MTLSLEATKVFEETWDAVQSGRYRYIILQGGSRSSKTTSLIQCYLLLAIQESNRMTVWREKRTWAKASVWNDLIKYLSAINIYKPNNTNQTDLIYKLQNSTIEINGLDDYQKLHGLTQDYAWLNEAIESKKEDFDQIDMRTGKIIFIDFNPTEESHWAYDLARQDNAILLTSTVLDNPFAPEEVRKKILSYEPTEENIKKGTADRYKWEVYGLGKAAKKEGVIFTYELIKEWPAAREIGYGLDFGFYPDPSACVRVGLFDGRLVLDEIFYQQGLNYVSIKDEPSIEKLLIENHISDKIIADSAAKAGISELRAKGFRVAPVRKYAGSVVDGIRKMQNYLPIMVTERSMNLKRELDNYTWYRDPRTDRFADKPIDGWDHLIDSARYVVMEYLRNRRGVKIS